MPAADENAALEAALVANRATAASRRASYLARETARRELEQQQQQRQQPEQLLTKKPTDAAAHANAAKVPAALTHMPAIRSVTPASY